MDQLDADAQLTAPILNAAYWVRHYAGHRQQEIILLGHTVRDAFNRSDNFEVLLIVVVEALRPLPEREAF